MIIVEFFGTRSDGVNLFKRYSDLPGYILHKIGTDEYYGEAIDVETAPWFYEEVEDTLSKDD